MADKRITELAAASTVADADQLPLVQGGVTKRVPVSVLKSVTTLEANPPTGGSSLLTWTSPKTEAYTAQPNEVVQVDAAGASVAVTLPTTTVSGTTVRVRRVDTAASQSSYVTVLAGAVALATVPSEVTLTFTWSGSAWVVDRPLSGVSLLRAVGASDVAGPDAVVGLWPARSHIRYPAVRKLVIFDKVASLSGSTAASQTPDDAGNPGGSVRVTGTSFTVGTASMTVAPAVNVTDSVIRVRARLHDGSVLGMKDCYLRLYSSTNTANFHQYVLNNRNEQQLPGGVWDWGGAHIGEFTLGGTGADLTAITSVRIGISRDQGNDVWIDVASVEARPVTASKAKCSLWFDDGYQSHWLAIAPLLERYGWAATAAVNIAQADAMSIKVLRHLQDAYGWQIACHAYSNSQHNASNTSGDDFRRQVMAAKTLALSAGLWGVEDFAHWGGLPRGEDNMRTMGAHFRSCRYFQTPPRSPETLPPVSPRKTTAWGQGAPDNTDNAAAMKAYLDRAIAQRGWGQFVWHNEVTPSTSVVELLAYLDTKRAQVDVVTAEEALRAYTVSP